MAKKTPTMVDVAELADTTVATVSRVINNVGYVSDGLREKVEAAIDKVGYVPNANARALKTNRSQTIGVVVGDLMNPYSIELANTVTSEVASHGYTTFIGTATDDTTSELLVVDAFHRQRVGGLVVATLPTERSDNALKRLAKHGMPIVTVGRQLKHEMIDSISADFRRGGRLATQHLIELGHKRIAFVGAELEEAARVTRLQGYLDALTEAGIPIRPEYVVGNHSAAGSPRYSTHSTGHQSAHELLKLSSRPTAIFTRNDHTAFGVLQALTEAGVSVPGDISVVGFDNIPLTRRVIPALTTVSQPTENQGQLASEFLLGRIEQPDQEVQSRNLILECTLIARGSTAPPRGKKRPRAASSTTKKTTKKASSRAK